MELSVEGNRWTRPVIVIAAIAMIVFSLRTPTTPAPIAPPDAIRQSEAVPPLQAAFQAEPTAAPLALDLPPLAGHTAVTGNSRIALYTTDGSYSPDQVRALAAPLNDALSYVSDRTGMRLSAPVTIIFDHHDSCGLDGATYTERRTINLYACPDLPAQRAINIVAHEFVHQLAYDRYGAAHMQADLILSEGLATWGAGTYWLGDQTDFRGFVQHNYSTGLLPLGSHYRDYGTIDAMNRLYYEWASLVDFLITTHGRDTFDQLYASGRGMNPGTADYQGVLGTDLAGVEQQWQAWLSQ